MPEPLKTHYGIVGAGIAGIAAAEAIRRVDPDGPILLVNGEEVPPYCRPLIVEILRGERTFDGIRLRPPEWFKEKGISLINGDPAVRLSPSEKQLRLRSGRTVEWEKLLLACGSKPTFPPIDGLSEVQGFTMYRASDVESLQSLCRPGSRALLIGIGLIGLQAMTSLRELGVDVIAIELMPKILPLILDSKAAMIAQERLEGHGVETRVGTAVKELRVSDDPDYPYVALTDSEEIIGFDFLILATGMRPEISLLNGSGIEIDRGIKVSPEMETNVPGVYAAGDVTEYSDWIEGRSEIHAHWVNAYRQGHIAGTSMAGGKAEPYEPVYLNSLSVFGLPIITMGASRIDDPEGAEVYISEAPKRGAYERFVVRNGILIAATFIGDVDRAGVFQYLMREKVDIGEVVESLHNKGTEGLDFLYELHDKAVKGDVDWPESMYLVDWFSKDHKHTRWGKKEAAEKKKG